MLNYGEIQIFLRGAKTKGARAFSRRRCRYAQAVKCVQMTQTFASVERLDSLGDCHIDTKTVNGTFSGSGKGFQRLNHLIK
jgi:hypothetical protein